MKASGRQPLHTVYGGAHLFQPGTVGKLGTLARRALEEYAPDPGSLASALGLDLDLAERIYGRLAHKLATEPVEDYRVDFEDGYGYRSEAEEDGHADAAALSFAAARESGGLPYVTGFRIRSFREPTRRRALRTLDRVLTGIARRGGLPARFVVTLPKAFDPAEVAVLAEALAVAERQFGWNSGYLGLELMIETPTAVNRLPEMIRAAAGRCVAVHLGAWDYVAAFDVTAAGQDLLHPLVQDARIAMQRALAGSGVWLVDGATNVLPVPPHRGRELTDSQRLENRTAVHSAWRYHADRVRNSLAMGFYQGWDLHPAQIPARFAVVFAFFLNQLPEAAARLRNFVGQAARSTMVGGIFDDAATGQGLLNFFLRAARCGALSEEEVMAETGLSVEELRVGSFERILQARRGGTGL